MAARRRVLFIGNSLTYYNNHVGSYLVGLCAARNADPLQGPASDDIAAAASPVALEYETVTRGGASLSQLLKMEKVATAIKTGGFDDVVLQEDMYVMR